MIKKIIKVFLILIIIVSLTFLYARYIATSGLKTNEIVINTSIDNDFDGLKIVHFSDLHYKRIITKDRINDIINEINLINPDIVVFTGDLIDQDSNITNKDIKYLKETLKKINAKYGKYSVIGNHDYSIDIEKIRNIYKESDFILLENNYDFIYSKNNQKIFIGGISTGEFNESVLSKLTNEENIYKIIIMHEPDYIDSIKGLKPNIVMAGHSHNGQINIPYIKNFFLPTNAKKYYDKYYKIDDIDLYVSNGIGVSRVNFRLFNTPSINFYRINKK